MNNNILYPYKVMPLSYPIDSLEPIIDKKTIELHHDEIYKNYVLKLNQEIINQPNLGNYMLEEILFNPSIINERSRQKIIYLAGGVYNHELYFSSLSSNPRCVMNAVLKQAIIKKFGSVESFYLEIVNDALSTHDYEWLFLVTDQQGDLNIVGTNKNLTSIPLNFYSILAIDLKEHAYYLKYGPKKIQYVKNILTIINWDYVSNRYIQVLKN